MQEKSPGEVKDGKVEKTAKPREPEPMVPPVVPAVVAQKTPEGSRFWVWIGVPICVSYDEVQKLNTTGRVAVEKRINALLEAQIHQPRKQKGKDCWALKIEYPVSCTVVADACKNAVGQIRTAMAD